MNQSPDGWTYRLQRHIQRWPLLHRCSCGTSSCFPEGGTRCNRPPLSGCWDQTTCLHNERRFLLKYFTTFHALLIHISFNGGEICQEKQWVVFVWMPDPLRGWWPCSCHVQWCLEDMQQLLTTGTCTRSLQWQRSEWAASPGWETGTYVFCYSYFFFKINPALVFLTEKKMRKGVNACFLLLSDIEVFQKP